MRGCAVSTDRAPLGGRERIKDHFGYVFRDSFRLLWEVAYFVHETILAEIDFQTVFVNDNSVQRLLGLRQFRCIVYDSFHPSGICSDFPLDVLQFLGEADLVVLLCVDLVVHTGRESVKCISNLRIFAV